MVIGIGAGIANLGEIGSKNKYQIKKQLFSLIQSTK